MAAGRFMQSVQVISFPEFGLLGWLLKAYPGKTPCCGLKEHGASPLAVREVASGKKMGYEYRLDLPPGCALIDRPMTVKRAVPLYSS